MKNIGYYTSVRVQAQPMHKAWVARPRTVAPAQRLGLVSLRSSSETLEQRLDRVEVEMLRLAMGQPLGNRQLAGAVAAVRGMGSYSPREIVSTQTIHVVHCLYWHPIQTTGMSLQ